MRFIALILFLIPLTINASTISGQIVISLTIQPSSCIPVVNNKFVDLDCRGFEKNTIIKIDKNIKLNEKNLVTLYY